MNDPTQRQDLGWDQAREFLDARVGQRVEVCTMGMIGTMQTAGTLVRNQHVTDPKNTTRAFYRVANDDYGDANDGLTLCEPGSAHVDGDGGLWLGYFSPDAKPGDPSAMVVILRFPERKVDCNTTVTGVRITSFLESTLYETDAPWDADNLFVGVPGEWHIFKLREAPPGWINPNAIEDFREDMFGISQFIEGPRGHDVPDQAANALREYISACVDEGFVGPVSGPVSTMVLLQTYRSSLHKM